MKWITDFTPETWPPRHHGDSFELPSGFHVRIYRDWPATSVQTSVTAAEAHLIWLNYAHHFYASAGAVYLSNVISLFLQQSKEPPQPEPGDSYDDPTASASSEHQERFF